MASGDSVQTNESLRSLYQEFARLAWTTVWPCLSTESVSLSTGISQAMPSTCWSTSGLPWEEGMAPRLRQNGNTQSPQPTTIPEHYPSWSHPAGSGRAHPSSGRTHSSSRRRWCPESLSQELLLNETFWIPWGEGGKTCYVLIIVFLVPGLLPMA